ncbi:MAG: biotin--[acetyl-CoA-carboxylase] ligase [Bacteroidota bacterium]
MYKILAKTLFVGKKLIFLPSCHSTNEVATKLLETNDLLEGTVVITNDQTKGRGQRGNSWESQKEQNLTFSLILKPKFLSVSEQFRLNILISVGITDALNKIKTGFKVKWPNDIYYQDRKIAGILIQNNIKGRLIDTSVVGIGLNVNQQSFEEPKAISLNLITDEKHDLQKILNEVLVCIESRYIELKNGQLEKLKGSYLDNLYRLGENHSYQAENKFEGKIMGVTEDGQLEIDTKDGIRRFAFKEVEFLIKS